MPRGSRDHSGSNKSGRKGRVPLTPAEIRELDAALVQAFRTIQNARQTYAAARYIKFPPLPSIFSESLVIASAPLLFGAGSKAWFGGKECDVMVQMADGTLLHVEVKATAEHAFQEFKAKDLRADVLVWVRFGRRFQEGHGPIEIVLLKEPGRLISGPRRLDSARFRRLIGDSDSLKILSFDSLDDMLPARSASDS
jgi:hypothetical protein